ncbi:MAG: hypothetical protein IPL78_33725 [Chloroflexi bacterium]|nr:hypothetical protein [Chloroflexota bacterium]
METCTLTLTGEEDNSHLRHPRAEFGRYEREPGGARLFGDVDARGLK